MPRLRGGPAGWRPRRRASVARPPAPAHFNADWRGSRRGRHPWRARSATAAGALARGGVASRARTHPATLLRGAARSPAPTVDQRPFRLPRFPTLPIWSSRARALAGARGGVHARPRRALPPHPPPTDGPAGLPPHPASAPRIYTSVPHSPPRAAATRRQSSTIGHPGCGLRGRPPRSLTAPAAPPPVLAVAVGIAASGRRRHVLLLLPRSPMVPPPPSAPMWAAAAVLLAPAFPALAVPPRVAPPPNS